MSSRFWDCISIKLFVLFLFCQQTIQQQNCNKNELKKFDDIVAKIVTLGYSGRKFPENKAELKSYYEDNQKLVEEVNKYKNECLSGLSKQVTGIIIYSFKNILSQLNKPESKRAKNYLQAFPCMNRGNSGLNKCNVKLINEFLGSKNAEEKLRIPHLCCSYHRTIVCGIDHLRSLNGCTEFHTEIAENFIQSIFGNALNLICNDYSQETDKCESLGPTPKKLKSQRKTKSFILPLIDLLSSFPEI